MNNLLKYTCIVFSCWVSTSVFAQNVGINSTATTPNSSAQLDLNTGNTFTSPNGKGLLIPNVALSSSTDAVTISSPATSLLVYVPSGSGLTPAGYYYNSGTPGSPAWVQVITLSNTGEILTVHCTNLTNNTPTGFAKISLPSGSFCGGMACISFFATNGTDYQSHTEEIHFSAVNKGGTITSQVKNEGDCQTDAASTGSISGVAFTITAGAGIITLNVSAMSGLTPLTTLEACYTIQEFSGKTITEL